MRKAVVACSLLAVCGLGAIGYVAVQIKNTPALGDAQVVSSSGKADYVHSTEDSKIVAALVSQDIDWQVQSAKVIAECEASLSATEQARRDLEAQKLSKQEEFLQEQIAEAMEQQRLSAELEQKNRDAITEQGGINVSPDGYLDVTSQVGRPNQSTVPPASIEKPNSESDTKSTDGYYGQFAVELVCTCDACFDAAEWPAYSAGYNGLLVDSSYIPAGIEVQLSGGIAVSLNTTASTEVSGRSCIALISDHGLAGDGGIKYPKIQKKG